MKEQKKKKLVFTSRKHNIYIQKATKLIIVIINILFKSNKKKTLLKRMKQIFR
jgi:hypothetical protein